ncbi:hypothetical protein BFS16_08950 [Hoylesella timonensis]|uniref:Uncharacterized protein n=1 Tax=Hoylesella timonensis TaxID=386414 RepID=A0A2K0XG97_9BACT|nr:hypothetical protein [Hoylesella timonensis]PNP93556.1 hypothetical protein BFS16_08950 [Hoylesella timonensis]
MNTIEDNTCDKALCNSDDNGQGLDKAANNLGDYIRARAWRSRNRNIVQDNVQQMLQARTGKAANNLGVYIWARTGRSRNRNIVQDNVQQMLRAKTGRSCK